MTTSTSDPVPKDKLRPLSSATNLTDFTHSTVEPESELASDGEYDDLEVQSLSPSMYENEKKYGRTYHSFHAGAYPFPNDEPEIYRLDWQHAIIKCLLHRRNYFAPLKPKKPKRMLDIGCGTGIWCFEMAAEFPNCRVEGIDLTPIQRKISYTNIDFYMEDILSPTWWYPKEEPYVYDYIHTRMSLGIFNDFREIIQKSYNNLRPGGWMESQEWFSKLQCADDMPEDYPLKEWSELADKAAHKLGRPLRIADKLKRWYKEAGFVDVHEGVFAIPANQWPKSDREKMLGKYCSWNLMLGLQGWSLEYFVTGLGLTPAEVEVYLAHVRNSIVDENVHAYYNFYVVWGRKPFDDEPGSTTPKPHHWPQPPGDDDSIRWSMRESEDA
ncbi:hypothetical protein AA0118_g46 [Alternaria tenuissima]|nr:hypothetical protein AA0118_g46 [Alternaria tenuissima]